MFPERGIKPMRLSSFPRVSGDVSNSPGISRGFLLFSPRERGCFLGLSQAYPSWEVFPA